MEASRSQAVVLRKVAYGESDLIVTLLARDRGRLSALARGARRSRRRFGAALELFTVSTVELRAHRGELWTLSSAETTAAFGELSRDMAALAHGSYATELVRELGAPEQPEPEVFDLLVDLYRAVSARGPRTDVLRAFELTLLGLLGLAPTLEACASCGRIGAELERGALLDPQRGGVVCSACAPASRGNVRPLSSGARAVLVAAQRAGAVGALGQVDVAQGDDAAEARDAALALIHHHVGHPLRTLEFLGKLGRPVS